MSVATLRDVAREAGVSIATVSNTLNNPDIVRPETRDNVMAAAHKLSYVPNLNGQRLRMRESRTMGLFVSFMSGEFYGSLADSMFRTCTEQGYGLNICMISDSDSILNKLGDHTLDGAVIFYDHLLPEAREQMISMGCPLVFLGMERQENHVSCILFDAREQGRMAADYLIGLGKKQLMHIFGRRENYDSVMRWQGFRERLAERRIDPDSVAVLEGKFERAAAYRRMRQYLQQGKPVPDGIFASNDLSAIGSMAALSEAGYRMPEDVSIIGCDDIVLCGYTTPALTTIRTNFENTGSLAAEELLRLIHGGKGRTLRQSSSLVVRRSCQLS